MKLTSKQLADVFISSLEGKGKGDLAKAAEGFIKLLAQRQELFRVHDIIRQIDSVWKEKFGAANISVETAYPLSNEVVSSLTKAAKGATIHTKVNKELIGGAKIRIDDRLIDGTVAGRLMALKETLSQ